MARWSDAGRSMLGKRVALVTVGCLIVAGGAVVVANASLGGNNDQTSLKDASKVLQSVSVTMSPNGDLTAIKGSVVGTTSKNKTFSNDATYSPKKTASDLPVRVTTAYRTAKKQGTNLSDLDGYTGKVDIQVTVQNLTTKAKKLTYDVDGRKRTQSAMVGVPLTMVASTSLGDTKPSAVQTSDDADSTTSSATNGVLSQDKKGHTQVQWATILAPPQLGSSTTMRLALDAKDFEVPAFDISVQPGLVTDPSVGALIDSAFNPSKSSQYRLQQRTVALISDVNAVLARAGKSMDTVQTTLNDSSKTLGTKTVSDLKSSTTSIATSVKGLQSSVTSLGQDLNGSLTQTKSSTITELQQLVQSIDATLGDTSAKAPAATVTGAGCDVRVATPSGGGSVYGNLLRVRSLLAGYSGATTSCKDSITASITSIVGPSKPGGDDQPCLQPEAADSVTCTIYQGQNDLRATGNKIVADGLAAIDSGYKQLGVYTAFLAAEKLETSASSLSTTGASIAALLGGSGDLGPVSTAVNTARDRTNDVRTAIKALHQQAQAGLDAANTLAGRNQDLAAKICQLTDLSDADRKELRGYVTGTDCPANDTDPAPSTSNATTTLIQDQVDRWTTLVADTDTADETTGLGQKLAAVDQSFDAVNQAIATAGGSGGDLSTLLGTLSGQLSSLTDAFNAFHTAVGDKDEHRSEFNAVLDQAFIDAQTTIDKQADQAVEQIRRVSQTSTSSTSDLDQLFDNSLAGLGSAGDSIVQDGAKSIDKSKADLKARQSASSKRITSSVDAGLKQVSSGVTSSTKDMAAAQGLLTKDLQDVLLDLGVRNVKGSGLLGAMATSAATTKSATGQLGQASDTTSSYANVRQGDIAGILLKQAQADESRRLQAALPAFHLTLPASATHRTVYSFHIGS